MTGRGLDGDTAVVTGASRGFGYEIAAALVDAGACVVGMARGAAGLNEARTRLGERFVPVPADAADPEVAQRILATHRPSVVVLCAGAPPPAGPLPTLTWKDFETNWRVDVRQAFEWLGAALRLPLDAGSRIVVVSSGAALQGSPASGGYAAAKAAVRFLTRYAAEESDRGRLGITLTALLPQLTPLTELGRNGAQSYADRLGVPMEDYLTRFQPLLTPKEVGAVVRDSVTRSTEGHEEVILTGAGPQTRPLLS